MYGHIVAFEKKVTVIYYRAPTWY